MVPMSSLRRVALVAIVGEVAVPRLPLEDEHCGMYLRKDGQDDARVGQEGENPQATGAASTAKDVDLVNTPEELGPRQTSRASGQLVRGRVDAVGRYGDGRRRSRAEGGPQLAAELTIEQAAELERAGHPSEAIRVANDGTRRCARLGTDEETAALRASVRLQLARLVVDPRDALRHVEAVFELALARRDAAMLGASSTCWSRGSWANGFQKEAGVSSSASAIG
jgi:hypothetical protein